MHEGHFLGTDQQPLAATARGVVDPRAYVIEKSGGILDLFQYAGRRQFLEKAARIGAYAGNDIRVFQQRGLLIAKSCSSDSDIRSEMFCVST